METVPESMIARVRELLIDWNEGDVHALNEIVPLVYDELRRRAARLVAREAADLTPRASDIVHETYLRLARRQRAAWQSEAHFLAVCSVIMHHLLVEHMRRKRKRGFKTTVKTGAAAADTAVSPDLLALDEALTRLGRDRPEARLAIVLRLYECMTLEQIAIATGVSKRTVQRRLAYANDWLTRELQGAGGGD